MAITFDSLAQAKSKILGYFRTQLSDYALGSRDFFGKLAAVDTLVHYAFLTVARKIDNDAVPTSSTSTAGIDEWAANGTGISNGAGGYGRKLAVAATGGVGAFTGSNGTIYGANATFTGSDGVTKFVLTNGPLTVGVSGTINGNINATTLGSAGNQSVSAVLTVDAVPVGGSASVTLSTATVGGSDLETNASALARIQDRLRNPPKGGTAHDYRVWLENAVTVAFDPVTGLSTGIAGGVAIPITRAYVFPRRYGTGTVDVVITQAGSGQSRSPGSTNQTNAQAYLDSVRPITVEQARALLANMPSANGLDIVIRPIANLVANAFQFDSTTGGPYTVSSYSAGPPATVTLSGNCADLNTQVNVNGKQPLIQIIVPSVSSSYLSPLPQVAMVTAYNAGTHVATLGTLPAGWVTPGAGNAIYAGSPLVLPIATALLALVDALGPSKMSGTNDPGDSWNDTLAIDQIIRTALNVNDGSGVPYSLNLNASPTIGVNGGAGASTDRQAADTSVATSPELLWTRSISVTP